MAAEPEPEPERTFPTQRWVFFKHAPTGRVGDNSAGVDQIRVHNDAALRAIQRGHLDAILHRVRPEDGPTQVVDGHALWAAQVCQRLLGQRISRE